MPEASTVCSSCNPGSPLAKAADISMVAVVGPEIVTGSSRMKAGTAQKLILNMLSTGAISVPAYGNLMVDVEATNAKLVERQKRIVMEATELTVTRQSKPPQQPLQDRHRNWPISPPTKRESDCRAAAVLSANAPIDRPIAHWPCHGDTIGRHPPPYITSD